MYKLQDLGQDLSGKSSSNKLHLNNNKCTSKQTSDLQAKGIYSSTPLSCLMSSTMCVKKLDHISKGTVKNRKRTKPRSQDKIGEERNKQKNTNISGIDKGFLLYELWKKATPVPWLIDTPYIPVATLAQTREDIRSMENSKSLNITFYYGKVIQMDLTMDTTNTKDYNDYNGKGKAEKIIEKLMV